MSPWQATGERAYGQGHAPFPSTALHMHARAHRRRPGRGERALGCEARALLGHGEGLEGTRHREEDQAHAAGGRAPRRPAREPLPPPAWAAPAEARFGAALRRSRPRHGRQRADGAPRALLAEPVHEGERRAQGRAEPSGRDRAPLAQPARLAARAAVAVGETHRSGRPRRHLQGRARDDDDRGRERSAPQAREVEGGAGQAEARSAACGASTPARARPAGAAPAERAGGRGSLHLQRPRPRRARGRDQDRTRARSSTSRPAAPAR